MAISNGKMVPFATVDGARKSTDQHSADVFDVGYLRDQNTLGKKITEARKTNKISQKELASRLEEYGINISSGSISKWEKGDAMPNSYQLLAVCHILRINEILQYFTGCTPEPQDYTPELNQKGLNLLQMFKETLIASGKYAPRSRRVNAEPVPEIMVKVFSTPAAAGSGSFLEGEDYDMIGFDPANVPEGTDFGIRVTGNSMLPRYVPGQIVFVEQCEELFPGEIGVFICNDNAYIKQYREETPDEDEIDDFICDGRLLPKVTLFSLNRECADCDVHPVPGDRLVIVGRVLN